MGGREAKQRTEMKEGKECEISDRVTDARMKKKILATSNVRGRCENCKKVIIRILG